jgi:hypothetical protein
MKRMLFCLILVLGLPAHAQLGITVSPPKLTGNKAVVPLAMKNGFAEPVESARAFCFLLDDHGKAVGQATRWVIGGGLERIPLAPGATNVFHFVITADKPFSTTNLTTRVQFSRVVLQGGKLADVRKDVQIVPALK